MYQEKRLCIAALSNFPFCLSFAYGTVSFRSAQSYPVEYSAITVTMKPERNLTPSLTFAKLLHAASALPPPNGGVGGYGQAIRAMFEYADSPAALAARTR